VEPQRPEGVAEEQLDALGHVPLPGVSGADPVAEIGAPEAPEEDLREGERTDDGPVVSPDRDEGLYRRLSAPPQPATEAGGIYRRVDPGSMKGAARTGERQYRGTIAGAERAEPDSHRRPL
jgi:hypothetical protein